MHVAPAAAAAARHNNRRVARNIGNHQTAFRIADYRPARYADHKIGRVFAAAPSAAPVLAVLRRVLAPITKIHQRGKIGIGSEYNIAAAAAVSAVRPARCDIFFPMERHRAVAAVARRDMNGCGINKHAYLLCQSRLAKHRRFFLRTAKKTAKIKIKSTAPEKTVCPRHMAFALRMSRHFYCTRLFGSSSDP